MRLKWLALAFAVTSFSAVGGPEGHGDHCKAPEHRPRDLTISPAAPARTAPDPRLVRLLSEVSTVQLRTTIEALAAIPNRASNSPGIQVATDYLQTRFRELGYAPEKQCFDRNAAGDVCNVIARKAAAQPTRQMVVVVGHFDSVGRTRAGADDNASGTAGVLEIARILANRPTATNVVFVAANAEETGLFGSKYFVAQLEREGKLADVKFTQVMDMESYNTGRVDVETFEAHRALGQAFVDEIRGYAGLDARLIIPGWGSDHVSFLNKGVPTFLAIVDTDVQTPCYHRECDKVDTIDFAYFTKMIQVNLLAVARAAIVGDAPALARR